jgi:hypothetical protein
MNTLVSTAPGRLVSGANRPTGAPFGRLGAVGRWLWHAFEVSAQTRARREMLDFADRCEGSQPGLAAELRAASGQVGQA